MGLPMARKLYESGFEIWGFDVRPVGEFGDFQSRMISDPKDFSARVDTVISVVRDLGQTMDLCFDSQAIFSEKNPPNTFICSSTLAFLQILFISDFLYQLIAILLCQVYLRYLHCQYLLYYYIL